MFVDGVTTTVQKNRPVLYPGQQELYHRLMANGIAVYVLSASSEEIVRMIASDPQYGYNLPPENVIGVSLFLRNHAGDFTTARTLIEAGTYNASAMGEYWMTSVLQTPHTWITGKWAAILQYIDQWRLPVLVAGDTPKSDGPMIFHGIDRFDGIKLWVNRSASNLELINEMTANYSKEQEDLGLPVTADKGWLVVTPDNLLNLNGGS
jgi:hypothetical protein